MQRLLSSILLTIAACGGGAKSSTATQRPVSATEQMVDPTVPSWLPESCLAYHKAVVHAINCKAVEQGKRDTIKSSFDATSVSWKAEQNADKARVDEVGAACIQETLSVRADIDDRCV